MKTDSIKVSGVVPATCEAIYTAWLDGKGHTAFTGAGATAEPGIGGGFTAWEGYIQGRTLALEPSRRIVQAWRTAEFPEGSPDSELEVLLEPAPGGTQVSFVHTNIPEGQGIRYEAGWTDFYLTPMRKHFSGGG